VFSGNYLWGSQMAFHGECITQLKVFLVRLRELSKGVGCGGRKARDVSGERYTEISSKIALDSDNYTKRMV
jgi:hypothetical protein